MDRLRVLPKSTSILTDVSKYNLSYFEFMFL